MQEKRQLPPGQLKVQFAPSVQVIWQPPPAQSLLQVELPLHVSTQPPPSQCELQLASSAQRLWHWPDAQVISQLALPLQVCVQLAFAQSCVQMLALVQLTVQSPPVAQVSWHCAVPAQLRLHWAPLHLALQSLLPLHALVHTF